MRICTYEKCGKETKSLIRGFCPTCYAVFRRTGSPERQKPNRSYGLTRCANEDCGSDVGPFIRGLCRPCYQRQYNTGTVAFRRPRHLCEVKGCNDPVRSHGLCEMHHKRVLRHGDVNAGRPAGWGQKSKHPLYQAYLSMMRIARRAHDAGHDPRWRDFWLFVEDVGEKPPKSRLYRKDPSLPFSKENVEWRAAILDGARLKDHAAYQRAHRAKRGPENRDAYLRRTYRISSAEFDAILERQGGGCAICGAKEGHLHPITKEPVSLAMDHSHAAPYKNRGILCHRHNPALGLFSDNRDHLRAAIAYLDAHAETA